jgi:hypothetical protein
MIRRTRTNADNTDDENESDQVGRQALHIPVDIGPSWLLLSHGAFLAAIVEGSNTAYYFIISNPLHITTFNKTIAILKAVGSLLLGMWTIYAISGTWRENAKLKHPVYGDIGFVSLIMIVLYLMAVAIVTLVAVITYPLT